MLFRSPVRSRHVKSAPKPQNLPVGFFRQTRTVRHRCGESGTTHGRPRFPLGLRTDARRWSELSRGNARDSPPDPLDARKGPRPSLGLDLADVLLDDRLLGLGQNQEPRDECLTRRQRTGQLRVEDQLLARVDGGVRAVCRRSRLSKDANVRVTATGHETAHRSARRAGSRSGGIRLK